MARPIPSEPFAEQATYLAQTNPGDAAGQSTTRDHAAAFDPPFLANPAAFANLQQQHVRPGKGQCV